MSPWSSVRARWRDIGSARLAAAMTVLLLLLLLGLALGLQLARSGSGGPPAPSSPAATPSPTPTATPSMSAGTSVLVGPAPCENAADGYAIEVPDRWWYSPACDFLDPASFAMGPLEPTPRTTIRIVRVPNDVGTFDTVLARDEVIVAGRPAVRWELGIASEGALYPAGTRVYAYIVQLGPSVEVGPNLMLQTDSFNAPDYEAAKTLLDEIVRSLRLGAG